LEAGYNFDFVDDEILAHEAHIAHGKLAIANQEFPIVVLPGIERIPPSTLAKLGEFAKSGGILVATRRLPSLAPGYLNHEPETAAITRQVEELFQRASAPGHFVATEDKAFEDELPRLSPPDVVFSPRTRDVGFVHRHTDSAEIYFIANASNHRVQTTAKFRVKDKHPEWWNPFTGEATLPEGAKGRRYDNALALDLEPYGSRFLVFTNRKAEAPDATVPRDLPRRDDLDISRDWLVTFEGTSQKLTMNFLRPWTEIAGMQFYSGRATYERKVYVPGSSLRPGMQARLNFGESTPIPVEKGAHYQAWLDGPVREAAEVIVNGRRAGSIWHPPYELDVTPYLHAGENEVRIVVGNTAVNEMAGRPLPDRSQLTAKFGERFVDQGNNLVHPVPSGLTGPIRILMRSAPPSIQR